MHVPPLQIHGRQRSHQAAWRYRMIKSTNAQLIEKARDFTAAEHYDITSKQEFVVTKAKGAWVFDGDGRQLLDMGSADGTVLLGHRNPVVNLAVINQLHRRGVIFPTSLSPARIR